MNDALQTATSSPSTEFNSPRLAGVSTTLPLSQNSTAGLCETAQTRYETVGDQKCYYSGFGSQVTGLWCSDALPFRLETLIATPENTQLNFVPSDAISGKKPTSSSLSNQDIATLAGDFYFSDINLRRAYNMAASIDTTRLPQLRNGKITIPENPYLARVLTRYPLEQIFRLYEAAFTYIATLPNRKEQRDCLPHLSTALAISLLSLKQLNPKRYTNAAIEKMTSEIAARFCNSEDSSTFKSTVALTLVRHGTASPFSREAARETLDTALRLGLGLHVSRAKPHLLLQCITIAYLNHKLSIDEVCDAAASTIPNMAPQYERDDCLSDLIGLMIATVNTLSYPEARARFNDVLTVISYMDEDGGGTSARQERIRYLTTAINTYAVKPDSTPPSHPTSPKTDGSAFPALSKLTANEQDLFIVQITTATPPILSKTIPAYRSIRHAQQYTSMILPKLKTMIAKQPLKAALQTAISTSLRPEQRNNIKKDPHFYALILNQIAGYLMTDSTLAPSRRFQYALSVASIIPWESIEFYDESQVHKTKKLRDDAITFIGSTLMSPSQDYAWAWPIVSKMESLTSRDRDLFYERFSTTFLREDRTTPDLDTAFKVALSITNETTQVDLISYEIYLDFLKNPPSDQDTLRERLQSSLDILADSLRYLSEAARENLLDECRYKIAMRIIGEGNPRSNSDTHWPLDRRFEDATAACQPISNSEKRRQALMYIARQSQMAVASQNMIDIDKVLSGLPHRDQDDFRREFTFDLAKKDSRAEYVDYAFATALAISDTTTHPSMTEAHVLAPSRTETLGDIAYFYLLRYATYPKAEEKRDRFNNILNALWATLQEAKHKGSIENEDGMLMAVANRIYYRFSPSGSEYPDGATTDISYPIEHRLDVDIISDFLKSKLSKESAKRE